LDSLASHLNFEALLERSTSTIKNALSQGSPARTDMVLKILSWTAWSIRPLESQEMFAAIATRTDIDSLASYSSDLNSRIWPASDEELIAFCPDLLEIRPGRYVAFRENHLRPLIRSPWSRSLGFPSAEGAHESLAAVCFQHLACLDRETILRPWIKTGPMLRHEIRHCHFRSYCTNHWQDHYRAAETSSRKLVAMLHNTLEAACMARMKSRSSDAADSASRMSTGIWICSLWDLNILGRTYLEMGADVDRCSGSSEAPIHVAAANASTNMLRLLLDRGAHLEMRDRSGHTVLQQACRAGALDVASLLLEKGADPESSNSPPDDISPASPQSTWTPLHLAACHGHLNIVKALLQAGANLQACAADSGSTALHFAVEHGNEDAVRYLMNWGADLEAENAACETALKIAIQERHDSIVEALLSGGAKGGRSTPQDKNYIDRVLGSHSVASTLNQFQSLCFENTDAFPHGKGLVESNLSSAPIIVIPTSSTRYDDSAESAAECGWTMLDKMELDA
jgi:ankyrin repeat protein